MATKKAATQKTVTIKIDMAKVQRIEAKIIKLEQEITAKIQAGTMTNNSDLCILFAKYESALNFLSGLLFFSKNIRRGYNAIVAAIKANCELDIPAMIAKIQEQSAKVA